MAAFQRPLDNAQSLIFVDQGSEKIVLLNKRKQRQDMDMVKICNVLGQLRAEKEQNAPSKCIEGGKWVHSGLVYAGRRS